MRLYIAGPMSGYENKNLHWFLWAEERLRFLGYDVLNPAANETRGQSQNWYLREGLKLLLQCDGIAVLPGWECSFGSTLEVHVAQQLQMIVKPVVAWEKLL